MGNPCPISMANESTDENTYHSKRRNRQKHLKLTSFDEYHNLKDIEEKMKL